MTARGRSSTNAPGTQRTAVWDFDDARDQFKKLVRDAETVGPQHIVAAGRERAVLIGVDTYRRLTDRKSDRSLFQVMQACPDPGIDFDSPRVDSPVRAIEPF